MSFMGWLGISAEAAITSGKIKLVLYTIIIIDIIESILHYFFIVSFKTIINNIYIFTDLIRNLFPQKDAPIRSHK